MEQSREWHTAKKHFRRTPFDLLYRSFDNPSGAPGARLTLVSIQLEQLFYSAEGDTNENIT
jgi:hypothetical protein